MIEVTLLDVELLVLMDALRTTTLIGYPLPTSSSALQARLIEGQVRLAERGLLTRMPTGTLQLDPVLLMMGAVMAFPQAVCVTSATELGRHAEVFIHYCSDGLAVELIPSVGSVMLRTLPAIGAIAERLIERFAVRRGAAVGESVLLPMEVLDRLVAAAARQDYDTAAALLNPYELAPRVRGLLLNAFCEPALRGMFALLRCQGREVVFATNPAFVQGPGSAWLITQAMPGSMSLLLESVDMALLRQRIAGWMSELGPTAQPFGAMTKSQVSHATPHPS